MAHTGSSAHQNDRKNTVYMMRWCDFYYLWVVKELDLNMSDKSILGVNLYCIVSYQH